MELKVIKVNLDDVSHFRELFLYESNFQFVHNKCHQYGWADTYLLVADNVSVGYGAVWGLHKREDRDTIFEFYLLPGYRQLATVFFRKLCDIPGITFAECQTNDRLLSGMFYEFSREITAEAILFKDCYATNVHKDGVVLKERTTRRKDDRGYALVWNDEIVAEGGLMLNYNMPYADIYYETKEQYRNQGYGTLLLQELKREAYRTGRVPAARCNIKNAISKISLLKAGFEICGYLLNGTIARN